jgi:hypothetical protein
LFAFCGANAMASNLSSCLSLAAIKEHRIDKEEAVRGCFNLHKNTINKDICYFSLDKKVSKKSSARLIEEMSSICFYETTLPNNLDTCLAETKSFKNSINHDDALFYCYQQFQDKIDAKTCLKIANLFVFPLKKTYLKQHCNSN